MMMGIGYETLLPLCQGRGNSVVLFMFQSCPPVDLDTAMHELSPILAWFFPLLSPSFLSPSQAFPKQHTPRKSQAPKSLPQAVISRQTKLRKLCNQTSLFEGLGVVCVFLNDTEI